MNAHSNTQADDHEQYRDNPSMSWLFDEDQAAPQPNVFDFRTGSPIDIASFAPDFEQSDFEPWCDPEPDEREIEEPAYMAERRGPDVYDESAGIKPIKTRRIPRVQSIPTPGKVIEIVDEMRFRRAMESDRTLTGDDYRIAGYLLRLYDAGWGYAWPTEDAIAAHVGCSVRNVRRSVSRLTADTGWFFCKRESWKGAPPNNRFWPNLTYKPIVTGQNCPISGSSDRTELSKLTGQNCPPIRPYISDKEGAAAFCVASSASGEDGSTPLTGIPSGREGRPVETLLPADFEVDPAIIAATRARGVPQSKIDRSIPLWRSKRITMRQLSCDWQADVKVWLDGETIPEPTTWASSGPGWDSLTDVQKADFEKIWKHYDHQVDRLASQDAYAAALQLTTAQKIFDAVLEYVGQLYDGERQALLKTWLNGKRWNDKWAA